MSQSGLTIGKLSRAASVLVETIRYYQRIGLIAEPRKPMQGYRYYPPETVDRVRFIRRAQQLGFTLKEIAELLRLGDGHCEDTRHLAEQKCLQIEARMADLKAVHTTLKNLIKACESNRKPLGCPIVQTLTTVRK